MVLSTSGRGGLDGRSPALFLAQSLSVQITSRLLLFPPLPPPSCRCSHLSPLTLSARFALLDPTSLRRGRLDRRITLALPSHTTPGECDAEPVIVTASDVGGPMAKIPRDDRCEFCLAAPRDALRVHPRIRTSARGWRGQDELPSGGITVRAVRISRAEQCSPMQLVRQQPARVS